MPETGKKVKYQQEFSAYRIFLFKTYRHSLFGTPRPSRGFWDTEGAVAIAGAAHPLTPQKLF